MKEIEIKILDIDRKEVEDKLLALGAKKIFDGEIKASFFDFKDNSVRDNKNTVRLRTVGDKSFLTFKSPVPHDNIKIRDEFEVEVSDFENTKIILENLGLTQWLSMKKNRTSYKFNNVRFEFDKHRDQYEFVPEFLEIEAPTEEELYKHVELLNFKKENCKPWTILDIVNDMKQK